MSGPVDTRSLAIRLQAMGPAVEREVASELDLMAQLMLRRMRQLAPKDLSTLTNSLGVASPEPLVREVGTTGVAHGWYQEHGVKPGGKGLPRFFDPAANDIKAWLERRAFPGVVGGKRRAKPRVGTAAMQARGLELRDRYEGLAWHIRHHGVKARPFVRPAFEQMAGQVPVRIQAAVERGQAAGGSTV